jgi:AcrR family transcriptional regulator
VANWAVVPWPCCQAKIEQQCHQPQTRHDRAGQTAALALDELVAATGLGKATVYRLYPGKDDLVTAYLARLAGTILAAIDAEITWHHGDPAAALLPSWPPGSTQWRDWLAADHATSPGIWLITWKKTSGRPYLAYDDIVEEALAAGRVDSQPRTVDGQRSARLLTRASRPATGPG